MGELTVKHNQLTAKEFIYLWESVWGDRPTRYPFTSGSGSVKTRHTD